jgi:hypothetical protein
LTLILREISDVIDVGDRDLTYRRNLQETVLLSESIITHQSLIRPIQDLILLSEAIDTPEFGIRIRTISDTITLSELLIRYGSTIALITDNITLSESLSRQRKLIRLIENWIGHLRYKRHITNTTTLSESLLTQIKRLKHLITDDTTLSELVVANVIPSGVQFIRRPEDTIVLSQILSRKVEHLRTASDSLDEKFDTASGDQFFGSRRRAESKQRVKESPMITAAPSVRISPPTRRDDGLPGNVRRRHRMRSL